jgi:hypothetical protein
VAYEVREETQNGNHIIERGSATRSNGQRIEMSDVYFTTAPADGAVGASFGPGWNEPRDKTARIIVNSAMRQRVNSADLMNLMLNSFAPAVGGATVSKQIPDAPSIKGAQDFVGSAPKPDPDTKGSEFARSGPKVDPRTMPGVAPTIDWRAAQHTDAIPPDAAADAPRREAEWLGEFLGVKRAKNPDLGKLTGLRIRLPGR